jgi:hypothetical protein
VSLIKERIKEIALNKGIPLGKFFKKLGVAPSGFSGEKIKNGTNSETIEKIVSLYPEVDLHWLITGKEEKEEKTLEKETLILKEPHENYENSYKDKYIEVLEENKELNKKLVAIMESNQNLKKDNKHISY